MQDGCGGVRMVEVLATARKHRDATDNIAQRVRD
jgi:hypothetical protein